ncbi:cation diffusion facilitator family transporter [Paenibacillus segetis]|uniref:Transporter YdfM n=1 Tax=Paenibacillus segetis TaxID=1325360 RepID=A0ABQ1YDQ9_9BACL|nr:cation diffusion facilitator family transporter [Paenibacillus segetis]GGH20750.1 putative transporter YdfM [Paenibacillus segetis]
MELTNKRSNFAILISLISNVALTAIKLVIGLLFNSQVLIADGVHNAGDVFASAAALVSMRISKRPPDKDHPYGHGKAEVIGAGIVAIVLVLASIFMGYHSILALTEQPHKSSVLVLIAAGISLIWKFWLYIYTMRVGKKSNSSGLIATAYDHLADVYASLAAVIGIILAMMGEHYNIQILKYGDPLAGIIVAYFVLKLAIHIGRSSVDVLMEKNIDEERMGEILQLIRSIPEVKRIDRIRAREHGHYLIVDVRVGISADLTIQDGHDISKKIKEAVRDLNPLVEEVLVHLNPWYENE